MQFWGQVSSPENTCFAHNQDTEMQHHVPLLFHPPPHPHPHLQDTTHKQELFDQIVLWSCHTLHQKPSSLAKKESTSGRFIKVTFRQIGHITWPLLSSSSLFEFWHCWIISERHFEQWEWPQLRTLRTVLHFIVCFKAHSTFCCFVDLNCFHDLFVFVFCFVFGFGLSFLFFSFFCEGISVSKQQQMFLSPNNKCKKNTLSSFFFVDWMTFEFLQFCFVGWTAFLGAEISSHFVLFGVFVLFVSFCVLVCKKSEGISVCQSKRMVFCLPKTNIRKMHSFLSFLLSFLLVTFEFLAFFLQIGWKAFLGARNTPHKSKQPTKLTNIFSFLFCFCLQHLWGYFCSQKAFHPTKQNSKKLKLSSNDQRKKKRVYFCCFVIGRKHICFCFDTEIFRISLLEEVVCFGLSCEECFGLSCEECFGLSCEECFDNKRHSVCESVLVCVKSVLVCHVKSVLFSVCLFVFFVTIIGEVFLRIVFFSFLLSFQFFIPVLRQTKTQYSSFVCDCSWEIKVLITVLFKVFLENGAALQSVPCCFAVKDVPVLCPPNPFRMVKMLGKSSVRSEAQLRLPWGKEKPLQFLFLTHHVHAYLLWHSLCLIVGDSSKLEEACHMFWAKHVENHVLKKAVGVKSAFRSLCWKLCMLLKFLLHKTVWMKSETCLNQLTTPHNNTEPPRWASSCSWCVLWEKLTSGMSQSTLLSWVRVRVRVRARVTTQKINASRFVSFTFETWSVCFSFLFFVLGERNKKERKNKID